MAMRQVGFRILAVAVLLGSMSAASAQEFVPYPNDRITAAEWQSYFDLVASNHAATRLEIPSSISSPTTIPRPARPMPSRSRGTPLIPPGSPGSPSRRMAGCRFG